jgi:sigma-B regulation protein RsbU (phosphoserine phosphatase)
VGEVRGHHHPGPPVATAPAPATGGNAEPGPDDGPEDVALVARAAAVLSCSLDPGTVRQGLADLVVPALGDWALVTALEDGGARNVAASAVDPADDELVRDLMRRAPTAVDPVIDDVLSGRGPQLRVASPHDVAGPAPEGQGPALAGVRYDSLVCVPLEARGRLLGALTTVRSEGGRALGLPELALAERVAALGATSLDNAAVHQEAVRSERRLRAFVDSLGAILWEADATTLAFTFVSRRAEEVLGYPVQRWTDERQFWAERLHPADRDYTVGYRRVATAEGRDHELEYRMVAADGRKVWVQDIVQVEMSDSGSPSRLRGVMVDITRRKRVERVLLQSRERFASLARTLQASLLPPHLPEIPGLEVAARYRPAEDGVEVVGDFYDLFDLGNDGWGVVIGDVCGKGPEAAALTAVARYTVRAAAMRERQPSRVLVQLNDAVLHQETDERFCTAIYARVAPAPGGVGVSLSCGGHPLPLVLRADGAVEPAGRPGTLLGLFDAPDLTDEEIRLGPGDAAVFFTDGATEAKHRGATLGEERLGAIVSSCAGLRAEEIASRIEDAIATFQDGAPQDDLAIVVLRVPGETDEP